jgi:hypothetical protein
LEIRRFAGTCAGIWPEFAEAGAAFKIRFFANFQSPDFQFP